MRKFTFLFLSLFLTVNAVNVFAQPRPTIDVNLQKSNKRPPQTVYPQPKTETSTAKSENSTNIQPEAKTAEKVSDDEVLRVDTNLVTIPVKISDRSGRLISGLKKEDFKIFENNNEQEIAYFSNEEQPFTVALLLDMSYSTTFKITEIQAAASAFISQLRPNDKVMIVSFDEDVHVLSEPTNDRSQLLAAIKSTKISNGTSIYEAVDLVINQKLKKISGRKAIVLFTDGVDTTSRRASDLSNRSDASELDALIYPVQYDTYNDVQRMKNKSAVITPPIQSPIPSSKTRPFPLPTTASSQGTTPEEYRKAGQYLDDLANRTGGRIYQATTTANLATAFSNIANELREFYSLGYYPQTEGKTGERRKIKVRINKTDLAVQARDSYVVGKKGD